MEDRRTRTDGAKKRHSESGGGLLRSCSAEKQTGRLPDSGQVACRYAGASGARLHVVGVQSCGVNESNFKSLPMLGRSLSKAVQGSEGNRQRLPSLRRHAEHDFRGLEDGDKPDTRAVRVAVCAMTAWRGLIVKAIGRNVTAETTAKPLAAAMSFFSSARARIGILRIGGPEPASRNASQVKAAGRPFDFAHG
jgi:hypothetical protein